VLPHVSFETAGDDLVPLGADHLASRRTLRIPAAPFRIQGLMSERATLLAKCEELLAFLAAHDDHLKLRRLVADIEELRDRLLASEHVPAPEPPDEAAD
jgi:hypothetical protein